jgi:hypothetical protein
VVKAYGVKTFLLKKLPKKQNKTKQNKKKALNYFHGMV